MSVIADVYNGLKTKIASVTGVNTVELFNDQYNNEQRERVTKYPAVYIEFSSIEWQMSSHLVARNIKKTSNIGNLTQQQKGAMEITIHLAYQTLKKESDSFAELDAIRHNIYKSLSNYMITTEATGLQRKTDVQDTNHDGVIVWKTVYTLSVEEKAWADTNIVDANEETETPITLDLNIELDHGKQD